MIKELIDTSGGCDQNGDMEWSFYSPTLKKDIGEFKTGQRIEMLSVDFDKGIIGIYPDNQSTLDDSPVQFKISIVIGEQLPSNNSSETAEQAH